MKQSNHDKLTTSHSPGWLKFKKVQEIKSVGNDVDKLKLSYWLEDKMVELL